MRAPFIVAMALALATGPGCFVWDELDAGEQALDRYGGKPAAEEPLPGGSAPAARIEGSLEAMQTKWWQSARSLGRREAGADLVRCRVAGSTVFTRTADCQARGGLLID